MSEWEKDRQDLLEGIEVFVERIRLAISEKEFHEAVSDLRYIVAGALPVLSTEETI